MTRTEAQFILPDAYPQMVRPGVAGALLMALRSARTAVRAALMLEEKSATLRRAVRAYAEELEGSGHDHATKAALAHEIRGFAETAGMLATGRIAEGLCRYFDESRHRGAAPDDTVVALHVCALCHAARDPDGKSQMTDTVARELWLLADRKLGETTARRGA